ncbi:MAG: sodium:solute symporter family protein [Candidatus Kapabacteria bacterium]|nr:sodium:solute symporter family protein [Candidatus Kapabacteria bacterium]
MTEFQFTLSIYDISVIIIYFILILFIGFFLSRKERSEKLTNEKENFLLAGRKLTLPFFVATLVATWYGNILGIGEFIYRSGISAWVCFAFPYYIAAFIYALFFAKKIRSLSIYSIPEQFRNKYGSTAGIIASFFVLIISIPASYILMLGIMIKSLTGLNLLISMIAGVLLSFIYLYYGGFKADVLTNTAQFVLMYIGFTVIFIFGYNTFGSPTEIFDKLPENHKTLFGGFHWQYVLAWYLIAFQTFVDPSFHQRCSAVNKPDTAQKGILISIFLWLIFDSLTLSVGLYGVAFLKDINPVASYPILAEMILAPFWKGLFIVALLAIIMSTLESYFFISAATIGNDILHPLFKNKSKLSTKSLTQIGLTISAIFGICLAYLIPSAIDLIFKTASIAIPGLLFPMLVSFSKKYSLKENSIKIVMLVPFFFSAVWFLLQSLYWENIYFRKILTETEPMVIGIIASMILGILFLRKN